MDKREMTDEEGDLDHLIKVEVRELIRLMEQHDIVELAVQIGATGVKLCRPVHTGAEVGTAASQRAVSSERPGDDVGDGATAQVITAPMVGIYHASGQPGGRPLVEEGQLLEKGQVVGLIEAMKIMNDVDATVSGRVTRVLVADGQPVEYGQPLLVVEPE